MSDPQQSNVSIRLWNEGDLPLLERLMGDPAMTEYLGGPETPEQIRKRHERYYQISDSGNGYMFAIIVGDNQTPAGSVGYWEHEANGQTDWETGWSVLPEFQGQGIATKAMIPLIEQARANGKHRYIHAFPSIENGASNAICRKVGFTLEGAFEFEYPVGHPMRCNDWSYDLFAGHEKEDGQE